MGMSGCVIGGLVRPQSRDYCPNGRHPEAPSTPTPYTPSLKA